MIKNTNRKYTTVHIPTVLAKMIDEVIKNGELAYASRSEFIKDAIRRFLEYYGYYPRNKPNVKNDALYAGLSPDVVKLLTQTEKDSKKPQ